MFGSGYESALNPRLISIVADCSLKNVHYSQKKYLCPMHVLVIGQGIAGTWLSFFLEKAGIACTVIDEVKPNSASRVASGVINPVTGRQVTTTWQADVLLPFARQAYAEMEALLQQKLLSENGILAFPPTEQMLAAYDAKIAEGCTYVKRFDGGPMHRNYFNYQQAEVLIQPAYGIDLQQMLSGWRQHLYTQGRLAEGAFVEQNLEVLPHKVVYGGLQADYVFYCQGVEAAQSAYWQGLPFSFNKGEALLVEIDGLPRGHMYKFGITTLVPWHTGAWWLGSTYDNHFTDDKPTPVFRQRMELFLQHTLKLPYRVTGHLAAIRPATVERRPFAGLHPVAQRVGILGGLGTKGVSLAPWLAMQLSQMLATGQMPEPTVDVRRFKRAFAASV